jgi:HlyD family secretion protein
MRKNSESREESSRETPRFKVETGGATKAREDGRKADGARETKSGGKASKKDGGKQKSAPRWRQRALLVGLALLVVGGLVWAFLPSAVPVETAVVQRGTLQVTVSEDGKARFQERYEVSAPVAGSLMRVGLRPGDFVQAGQELTRVTPAPAPLLDGRSERQARTRVAAATAEVGRARSLEERAEAALVDGREQLRRQRILLTEASGSPSAIELAEADLRAREADVRSARFATQVALRERESAQLALARTGGNPSGELVAVRSPVSGRVLEVMRESEGAVQPGSAILTVGDPRAMELVVDLLSADAVRIRPGAPAEIERWGGEGALRATVRTVEPVAFTRVSALGIEEQRVNVVLDLDAGNSAAEALGDGYRVEARIVVWEQADVLMAPASAVFRDGDGWAAYRVENGRARKVPLRVGQRSDIEVQILAGLEERDVVITYPGDRVEDGVRVERR